ncbi:Citrate lyase alpha chain [Caballeronia fortuita]|uniref:Citrate lyase alpha chain n=2 Tax=Caballeronia fortuita TaxID=1777138 RepID=A0A158A6Z9_9BURK|nr:Citrate lyase alpha chain [Caballeronia fortuita]
MVVQAAAEMGLRGLRVAASSLFPVHAPLVGHFESGVVRSIYTGYVAGPVADAISVGKLHDVAILQTHGGRARAIESGELAIDIAFIAAPTADDYGNINGVDGPSACGVLGYAMVDAGCARHVVAVTDNLVTYPACPAEITQDYVDFVVAVPCVGDASQIVSGTTRVTEDPVGLSIAKTAANVLRASRLITDGFSFQTGAGGVSLAVAQYVHEMMRDRGVQGSFAAGGITGKIVSMLEEGLFRTLFDVQCFDLDAVRSYRENPHHQAMSASLYANPSTRGPVVNRLDSMILGASEIDLSFNVNVSTRSDGRLLGGSGGHSDTAAGAKLAMVTTKLNAGSFPKVVEQVTTVTTPGSSIDVVVTEAGVAVNPLRADLTDLLLSAGLTVLPIQKLYDLAQGGVKQPSYQRVPDESRRVVALQEYRDGTIVDALLQV